jgi:hypothetical protein
MINLTKIVKVEFKKIKYSPYLSSYEARPDEKPAQYNVIGLLAY